MLITVYKTGSKQMREETQPSKAQHKRLVYNGFKQRDKVSTSFLHAKIARRFLAVFSKPRFFATF